MKKLSSTLSNMVLSLGVITFVAGASLGTAYYVTKEPIAQMTYQTQVEAIKKVSPEFTNDPEADKWEYEQDALKSAEVPADFDCTLPGTAPTGGRTGGGSFPRESCIRAAPACGPSAAASAPAPREARCGWCRRSSGG